MCMSLYDLIKLHESRNQKEVLDLQAYKLQVVIMYQVGSEN